MCQIARPDEHLRRQPAVRPLDVLLETPPATMSDDEYRECVAGHSRLMRSDARKRFPHLDADDMAQELALYLLTNRSSRREWRVSFSCVMRMRLRSVASMMHRYTRFKPSGVPLSALTSADGCCAFDPASPPPAPEPDPLPADVSAVLDGLPAAEREAAAAKLADRKMVTIRERGAWARAVMAVRRAFGLPHPPDRPPARRGGVPGTYRQKSGANWRSAAMTVRRRVYSLGRYGTPESVARYHALLRSLGMTPPPGSPPFPAAATAEGGGR